MVAPNQFTPCLSKNSIAWSNFLRVRRDATNPVSKWFCEALRCRLWALFQADFHRGLLAARQALGEKTIFHNQELHNTSRPKPQHFLQLQRDDLYPFDSVFPFVFSNYKAIN